MTQTERLERQMHFILEVDQIKQILRQTKIHGGTRRENDAEHSWHIVLMAFVLAEHANLPNLDMLKIMKMLILHDLVEIDAGDTFAYDTKGNEDKREREELAADRIFGMLPVDQAIEFRALWVEFDDMKTPEARYAAAMDRLQPMLLNYANGGGAWQEHHIVLSQVVGRNRHIAGGSDALWEFAQRFLQDAVQRGWLSDDKSTMQ